MMYIPFMLWSFASLRVHTDIHWHTLLMSELSQNPSDMFSEYSFSYAFYLNKFFFFFPVVPFRSKRTLRDYSSSWREMS